ncbi:bacillithiol biosynthesis cysteine-adding enzyme BshC [Solibacillus sp. R5-41]|uniref:bacillithiol biosynthesis cysteine-adding enzyme BshC n=1 Tax=Solibacillus sp. R5-41 TaxID=2048654 RepID=UPI000C127C43|nr:bacillithiol biosynthesis cysteine-adding enzyme BshC [Solibacillus sp. R5-41]ATP39247.1 bacillithiol biosynthesis cysteine-adding enzyme BshC [Solibacillus sp. R5-41]
MKLEQIQSPVNTKLVTDYWSENADIHSFFEYKYNEQSFIDRANYLQNNIYRSKELTEIIRSFMEKYGVHEKTNKHLLELEHGAMVIVGGQQSGLLTGPLYSIHKAISVILLAQEQREKLNEPVVPMFWIAGEDHDIEEINHTYTILDAEVKKRGYSERSKLKTMASTTKLNPEAIEQFVKTVFQDFGETEYTEQLMAVVLAHAKSSDTFTDFFTVLMNDLFKNHGLLLLDATYAPFRKYEQRYFKELIENNEKIAAQVVEQEKKLAQAGYSMPIGATENNANLFFVKEGERFLLERKNGHFSNALAQVKLTEVQLLHLAEDCPEVLSNNVVTRPLMQEMAIPVLAFVGGPGELAYWATLKPAFTTLQLQMPIFAPRLNLTIVTRQVQQILEQQQLTVAQVFAGQAEEKLLQFIAEIQDQEAQQLIGRMNEQLMGQYEALSEYLQDKNYHVEKLLEKNKAYHDRQFRYLQAKISEQVLQKHDAVIRQYKTLLLELFPNGSYQERIYNPYQYINAYGLSFVDDLLQLPMNLSEQHQIISI